jgi:uncharacterized membrane protein
MKHKNTMLCVILLWGSFISPLFADWATNATSKINVVVDGLFTIGVACIAIPIFLSAWHLLVSRDPDQAATFFKGGVIAAILLAVGKTLLKTIATV